MAYVECGFDKQGIVFIKSMLKKTQEIRLVRGDYSVKLQLTQAIENLLSELAVLIPDR